MPQRGGRSPVRAPRLLVELPLGLDRLYGRWDHVSQLYRQTCATVGRQVRSCCRRVPPDWSGQAVAIDEKAASSFATVPVAWSQWPRAT